MNNEAKHTACNRSSLLSFSWDNYLLIVMYRCVIGVFVAVYCLIMRTTSRCTLVLRARDLLDSALRSAWSARDSASSTTAWSFRYLFNVMEVTSSCITEEMGTLIAQCQGQESRDHSEVNTCNTILSSWGIGKTRIQIHLIKTVNSTGTLIWKMVGFTVLS